MIDGLKLLGKINSLKSALNEGGQHSPRKIVGFASPHEPYANRRRAQRKGHALPVSYETVEIICGEFGSNVV